MNKLTKKLLLSVLTVVLTVIALGTTTFAWFTLTNVATLQQFSGQVVTDSGMEVSLDESAWYTTITTDIIQDYITANAPSGFFFSLVTSEDGVAFENLSGGSLTAFSGGYLRLRLFFRSNDIQEIAWTQPLSPGTTPILHSTGVTWISDVTFEDTHGLVTATSSGIYVASQAARISTTEANGGINGDTVVLELGTGADGRLTAPLRGNTRLNGVGSPYTFLSTEDGMMNYYFVKTTLEPGDPANVTLPTTIEPADLIVSGFTGLNVLSLTSGATASPNSIDYGTLYGGVLDVRIWLEGWDPDAFNAILSDDLFINLRFMAYEAT
ncbi:MAG: hypothetical protein IH571_06280 [Acholeplasmataceae bacterium]|nr:hypothetical protein [Acholeplasmataceae bacterium]